MREDGVAGGGVQGFPRVERLDDVLPAIKGRPEFAVSRRRGYVAVDYLYQTPDSFLAGAGAGEAQRRAAALRRECRGIKFDAITGEIVARPYAKFFNLGENEETRPESVDWSRPHRVLDKLDGSMVVPAEVEGGLRWMTRVSDAGVSTAAHAFAAARAPLMGLACEAIGAGWSPIFEWCGPSQRIVIEYPRDRMVLTGARHMRGGDVLPYPDLVDLAGRWGVPVVEELGEGRSGRALVEHVRALEDLEGCVVRFEDGAMIKLKADAYVARHRAVSDLASEKKVLRLVLEGLEDDVLPLLSAVDRAALSRFARGVRDRLGARARELEAAVRDGLARAGGERKRFATEAVPALPRVLRGPAFAVASGRDAFETLRQTALRGCGSAAEIEAVRPLIGGLRWTRPAGVAGTAPAGI